MKNPLTNLAGFLTAKLRETPEKAQHRTERGGYQEALRSLAYPLGEYLSDEFNSVDELFEYLDEEQVLPKETVVLLKKDKQFCRGFAEGLKAGQEAGSYGGYDEDEDDDEEDDEDDYDEEDYTYGSEGYDEDTVGEDTIGENNGSYDPEADASYDDEDEEDGFASQMRQFL